MSKERPIGFTILSIEKEILVKLEYKKLISNFEFFFFLIDNPESKMPVILIDNFDR